MIQKRFPEVYESDRWKQISEFVRSRNFEYLIEAYVRISVFLVATFPRLLAFSSNHDKKYVNPTKNIVDKNDNGTALNAALPCNRNNTCIPNAPPSL